MIAKDLKEHAGDETYKEIWYCFEYSLPGTNDWYKEGGQSFESLETARKYAEDKRLYRSEAFQYRIVEVTHVERFKEYV